MTPDNPLIRLLLSSPQRADSLTARVLENPPPLFPSQPPNLAAFGPPPMPNIAPQPPPSPDANSAKREQRNDLWRGAMSNFAYAMAQGLASHPHTRSFGAAMFAPFEMQERQQKMRLLDTQAEENLAQARRTGAYADQLGLESQARLEKLRWENELLRRRGDTETARTGLLDASAAKARYIDTDAGLFDVATGQTIEGTGQFSLEVTREIQRKLGLPEGLIGRTVPSRELANLGRLASGQMTITRTKEGVMLVNKISGEMEKLGDLPPPQALPSFQFLVDEKGNLAGKGNIRTGEVTPVEGEGLRKTAVSKGEREEAGKLDDMISQVTRTVDLAKKHSAKLGGPLGIRSRITAFKANRFEGAPELAELSTLSDTVTALRTFLLSGKQVAEWERNRLEKINPTMEQPLSKFMEAAKIVMESAQRVRGKLHGGGSGGVQPRAINSLSEARLLRDGAVFTFNGRTYKKQGGRAVPQ